MQNSTDNSSSPEAVRLTIGGGLELVMPEQAIDALVSIVLERVKTSRAPKGDHEWPDQWLEVTALVALSKRMGRPELTRGQVENDLKNHRDVHGGLESGVHYVQRARGCRYLLNAQRYQEWKMPRLQ